MYLLARAQALSGRPHDALVMLRRLAETGGALRMRRPTTTSTLRDSYPDGRSCQRASSRADSDPARPRGAATPRRAASAPAAAACRIRAHHRHASALEAVRFSTGAIYASAASPTMRCRTDSCFGDRLGRKLIVVGEGADHAVDFVRADSAGFHEISAIEIDAKRGDLWVASAAPAEGAGTLHKLQLISGRPLRSFPVAADLEPVTPVDLAVTAAGAVLVLDAAARQVLVLRCRRDIARTRHADRGRGTSESCRRRRRRDRVCGASRGISRIDLRARTATPVAAPAVGLSRSSRADPVAPPRADRHPGR